MRNKNMNIILTMFIMLIATSNSSAHAKIICNKQELNIIKTSITKHFKIDQNVWFKSLFPQKVQDNGRLIEGNAIQLRDSVDQGSNLFWKKMVVLFVNMSLVGKESTSSLMGSMTPVFGTNAKISKWVFDNLQDNDITQIVGVCNFINNTSITFGCSQHKDRIKKFILTTPFQARDKSVCDTFYRMVIFDRYH